MFKEISKDEYNSNIKDSKDFYVLVFHALWCPPCKMLKNSLLELSEKDDITVYRVDVDKYTDLAREFGVTSMPTWFIFKDGKMIHKGMGYQPYPIFRDTVLNFK
ncbi:co-chaperone YbbN [Mycoplasma sp. Mirounga ES2805-ORL]|uniref:thioredoxin family protein n=1 Tax=Mycoplasma sp. Mirounga ES2805-ORL TaxID=754514 RepID=UPI00197BDB8F|nr:thioredoxin family protein [Mycoplasma sp. Mirounga ES2805-ORL]QSF13402.1 thioredoxin family protein [Mycoplasma sp. Mirounga ES2805-ORL]